VLTAHLDHLESATPVKGDKIYNGALDNASGSAILLEMHVRCADESPAETFHRVPRSDGEEKGLARLRLFCALSLRGEKGRGRQREYGRGPDVWPLKDIVAYGAEHSEPGKCGERSRQADEFDHQPGPSAEKSSSSAAISIPS